VSSPPHPPRRRSSRHRAATAVAVLRNVALVDEARQGVRHIQCASGATAYAAAPPVRALRASVSASRTATHTLAAAALQCLDQRADPAISYSAAAAAAKGLAAGSAVGAAAASTRRGGASATAVEPHFTVVLRPLAAASTPLTLSFAGPPADAVPATPALLPPTPLPLLLARPQAFDAFAGSAAAAAASYGEGGGASATAVEPHFTSILRPLAAASTPLTLGFAGPLADAIHATPALLPPLPLLLARPQAFDAFASALVLDPSMLPSSGGSIGRHHHRCFVPGGHCCGRGVRCGVRRRRRRRRRLCG
jgi:hypothetical protein